MTVSMLSNCEAAQLMLEAGEPESVAVAELMALRDLTRSDAEMTIRVVAREINGARRRLRLRRMAAYTPAHARRDDDVLVHLP
jgi:hypothetical protein